MNITANDMHFRALNEEIKSCADSEIVIDNCIGQRYIGDGLSGKKITINGTPGNALGAYLNGAHIYVNGNAQDAAGDTMNEGRIVINGNSGDATGYAMRGGEIYVKGDVGYRAGIHMKAYKEKLPALVIGGCAGSFLGEYQAGGIIIVLGLGSESKTCVGYFCGTGMHGGVMYLRCDELPTDLPPQVCASVAEKADVETIKPYIKTYCEEFNVNADEVLSHKFYVLKPDTKNPYKQLYTHN